MAAVEDSGGRVRHAAGWRRGRYEAGLLQPCWRCRAERQGRRGLAMSSALAALTPDRLHGTKVNSASASRHRLMRKFRHTLNQIVHKHSHI
jgi:hypothetical protein